MSFLSRISLANRGLVALVAVAALVFGGVAATSLRQELVPSLEFPAAVVVTPYQGAPPEIVEREVTDPIEGRIEGLPGQTATTSFSNEGASIVQVEYEFGTDMDDAAQALQQAVDQLGRELPEAANPTVTVGSTDAIPVVALAASSGGEEQELAETLESVVVPKLEAISGVSDVSVTGARDEVVSVRLDPAELDDKNLTADQITRALQANGVAVPGGSFARGDDSLSVQVGDRFDSLEEIENLYVTPAAGDAGSLATAARGETSPASGAGQTTSAAPSGSASGSPTGSPSASPSASPSDSPSDTPSPGPGTPTWGQPAPPGGGPQPPPGGAQPPRGGAQPPRGGSPPKQAGQFPGGFPGGFSGGFPGQLPGGFAGQVPPGAGAAAPSMPDPVRLAAVADVELQLAEATSHTRTNGEPSLGVLVTKTGDGNAVDIANQIEAMLPELEPMLGDGGTLSVVFDQSPYVEQSIEGLTTEGLLGLAFAVLAILVFLLSLRSTLVTAVSIPLSVLVALIALWVGDFSLNVLTLGGLTIAIGRVVDDSIVVLENIKRHLEYGEEKSAGIITAVREVAGAITASTLTTVAVFLPIVFVGGQVGELFRPFGLTVAAALLASLVVSLTIIPVLAYWFLRTPRRVGGLDAETVRGLAVAREERSPLQRGYVPVIQWVSRHRFVTLVLGFAVFAGTLGLAPQLGTSFLGQSGQNAFSVSQELPPGTSLATTDDAAKQVETVLAGLPRVQAYQVTVGSSGDPMAAAFGGAQSGSNTAQYSILAELEADAAQFERRLRERLAALPDDVGELSVATGGFSASDVEVIVQAPDEGTLRPAAQQVERAVQALPDTTDVVSNLSAAQPRLRVRVEPREAAERGLTEAGIGQTVSQVYQGSSVTEAYLDGERRDVVVRLGSSSLDIDELRDLELSTATGEATRLATVADVAVAEGPVRITHADGERSASVTATVITENVGAVSADLQRRLAGLDLPEGATYSLGGVTSEQRSAFADLGLALLAAIVIVYIIMMATFRSIVHPLILLVSVPFAATGAIGLLLATGTPLGVPALIGMLMLVGIVVTNAIVLLDLINQYRRAGMGPEEAVIAGGRRRLRPILMTAVATICALVPMALGLTGDGAFISQPLAIVVIGGLTSSTVLTLVLVPALYLVVEKMRGRFARHRTDAPVT